MYIIASPRPYDLYRGLVVVIKINIDVIVNNISVEKFLA